jgi:hypothetical protein
VEDSVLLQGGDNFIGARIVREPFESFLDLTDLGFQSSEFFANLACKQWLRVFELKQGLSEKQVEVAKESF